MEIEIQEVPRVLAPGYSTVGTRQPAAPTPLSPSAPSRVTVLAPRGGEIVTVGHPVLVRWHTSCFSGLVFHQVQLSTDGGATYPWNVSPLLDGTDSHYLWHPTDDVVTCAARIQIVAINWGAAASDGPFIIQRADGRTIVPATPDPCVADLALPQAPVTGAVIRAPYARWGDRDSS